MRLVVCLLVVGLAVAVTPLVEESRAELLVYEGFEYEPGTLSGQDGGLGFAGAWSAGSVVADSLSFTDGNDNELPTMGNRALISASGGSVSSYRDLNRNYGTDENYGPGTYWVSFLGQRLQPHGTLDDNAARSHGFQLHNGEGDERVSAGRVTETPPVESDGWGLFSDGSGDFYSDSGVTMFDPSLVVMQVNVEDTEDGNNSDSAAMWVNPNFDDPLGTPDAELTSAAGNNFDYMFETLRLWAGGDADEGPYAEWTIDEIRIGTTFEDVIGNSLLIPGDTDGNGTVELVDLDPIRNNYRQEVNLRSEGDLTGDLFVDFRDFRQWKTAILDGGGSLAGVDLAFASVPEPASLALCGLAVIGIGALGRRRTA